MEEVRVNDELVLVCDYAHHPTEIEVVIDTLKIKYPDFNIAVIYQGHTYSRTEKFLQEYIKVLRKADDVFIKPIFSSVREKGFDDGIILKEDTGFKSYNRDEINMLLEKKRYIVAFLGAGDIDSEFIFFIKKVNY